MDVAATLYSAPTAATQAADARVKEAQLPETTEEGFGFDDLIDVINPLQHLPIVGMIYRELTDDRMSPGAAIAGGALYGGVMGLFSSLGNELLRAVTGKDAGETVLSLLQGDSQSEQITVAGDPYRSARAYQTAQVLADNEITR